MGALKLMFCLQKVIQHLVLKQAISLGANYDRLLLLALV